MAPENLTPQETKSLHDLKLKLQQSIPTNQLLRKKTSFLKSRISSAFVSGDDASLWRHDAVLLNFLRAREFNVLETLEMIRRTVNWRREFAVDGILEEDLETEGFRAAARVDGVDREGREVLYNAYGGGVCEEVFGSKEKQGRFLRWRVQLMERAVVKMKNKGGCLGMVQVLDLKDLLCSSMRDLRSTVEKMIRIFDEHYPGFIVKNIFINVSLRYYTHRALFLPLLAPRAESKFVFARPSKVTETLLKYIAPENIPVQYGGFKRENNDEFAGDDGRVSETFVRGRGTTFIEIPIAKPGVTIVWEVIVVGWDAAYREEFVPDDEGSYKILIGEGRKLERTMRNSFYIHEPGRLVLTIKNRGSRKKAIFHRSKAKPTFPCYSLQDNPVASIY